MVRAAAAVVVAAAGAVAVVDCDIAKAKRISFEDDLETAGLQGCVGSRIYTAGCQVTDCFGFGCNRALSTRVGITKSN